MLSKNLLLIISCLVSITTVAQTTDKRFAGLDTAFARVLKDLNAPGFSVAVVEKNKVIYSNGFGYSKLETKTLATGNTMYAIGSCTKAFTSSLIGLLEKDGKLSIDDKIAKHLPQLKFYNEAMNSQITIRDMMCHRTGLPRYDFSWYLFTTKSRDSILQRVAYQEPNYGVREKWQYNNFMFLAQGMLTEKITGMSWENNIRQKIFKPLLMHTANFSVDSLAKMQNGAKGYYVNDKNILEELPYYNLETMGPAGSINANVNEMTNWLKTWIYGGKLNGKEILPSGYVKEAMSSQMVMGSGLPSGEVPDVFFNNYGFGWMLASYKGHYRVEHGGNIDGFSASTCFFPTDSIGIVVLCNQNASRVNAVVRNLIADRLLKLPYKDWTTSTKRNVDSVKAITDKAMKDRLVSKKQGTKPSFALTEYDGIYTNKAFGKLEIVAIQDSLFAYLPNQKWWLRHFHYDIFEPFLIDAKKGMDTTGGSELRMQFIMDAAGNINKMLLDLEPNVATANVFTKTPRPKAISNDDLKKYEALFTLSGLTIETKIKNNKLYMIVPGQPEYELVPTDTNKFALKDVPGYSVQFNKNDKGEIIELLSIQPNGTFKAERKK